MRSVSRRLLVLLVSVAAFGAVGAGAACASTGEPVKAEFLRETSVGKPILEYLRCIDFDCADKLVAVKALGRERATPTLDRLLRHGAEPMPELPRGVDRVRVASALGAVGGTRAVTALIWALAHPKPLVRAEAAEELGRLRAARALDALVRRLRDRDELVRENSATALGRLGRPAALPPLRAALAREPKPHVRRAIRAAIAKLEGR